MKDEDPILLHLSDVWCAVNQLVLHSLKSCMMEFRFDCIVSLVLKSWIMPAWSCAY